MGLRPKKPAFRGVVDLGLRDVGVENDLRRHALQMGKTLILVFPVLVVSACAMCILIGATGAGRWIIPPLALAWTAGLVWLVVRMAKRAPMSVVKIDAEGTNQAPRVLIAPFLLVDIAAVLTWGPLMIPLFVLTAITAVLLWRGRGYVPEVLRKLRLLLATDESVLGDGVGRTPRGRSWNETFRLVAATDRRLLVVPSTRSKERFPLVDVPYRDVSRFGIAWKYWGQVGELSLTVAGVDGAPPETHLITGIAPANLLSIVRALGSHGVRADDPAAVSQAEQAWQEARRAPEEKRPREPREQLLDRAAMNTPEFDRGLWLLLALSVVTFYVNPFEIGLGTSRSPDMAVLLIVPVCAVCGYVSGTKSSLAYLAPLNLLVVPAFFFWPASYVIAVMLMLSAFAAAALWAGSALAGRAKARGTAAAGPGARPARGSLRYTIGGQGLIRLSGMMLAAMATLVVTASAAGFELTSVRLAIEEKTLKQVPVDGRSNLTGNAASITYTRGPDLREFITDNLSEGSETDGARWELRSSFTKGFNVVSLAHYVPEPRLDNPAAVADFVARKDREHARLAGSSVTHTQRVVRGRKGYVWDHGSPFGYWYYAAWFPHPDHTVRVECIAKRQERRFRRLCAEAVRSLEFR